jgi:hypothetical protein
MSTSRRTFLESTMAGAGIGWGALQNLASTSNEPPGGRGASVAVNEPPGAGQSPANSQEYTRGVGVYPGLPREDFGPTLVLDDKTYRNLALRRPAYHSSSYDYNLTAQLVTDGIKHSHLPDWVATSVSFRGPLPKNEREFILDHNPTSVVELRGPRPWVQIQLGGGESVPEVDRIEVLVVAPLRVRREDVTFTVSVSDDGREWKKLGSVTGPQPISLAGYPVSFAQPGQLLQPSIPLSSSSQSRFYQVECGVAHAPEFAFGMQWQIGEIAFFNKKRVKIGGPDRFTSAWMSAGLGEEWVYVDLGDRCEFDRVTLYWIARAAEGSVQASDDAQDWRDIQALPASTQLTDNPSLEDTCVC